MLTGNATVSLVQAAGITLGVPAFNATTANFMIITGYILAAWTR